MSAAIADKGKNGKRGKSRNGQKYELQLFIRVFYYATKMDNLRIGPLSKFVHSFNRKHLKTQKKTIWFYFDNLNISSCFQVWLKKIPSGLF